MSELHPILKRWRRFLSDHATESVRYHRRSAKNEKLVSPLEPTWPKEVRAEYQKKRMPTLELNRLHPLVRAITGREQMQRFRPYIDVPSPTRKGLADALNRAVGQVRELAKVSAVESRAFRSLAIGGLSCVRYWADPRRRRPEIHAEAVPIGEMVWDTRARGAGLLDRSGHGRGRWVDYLQLQRLYPKLDKERWDALLSDPTTEWVGDGSIWESLPGTSSPGLYHRESDEVFLVEFEWIERRPMVELDLPAPVVERWRAAVDVGPEGPSDEDVVLLSQVFLALGSNIDPNVPLVPVTLTRAQLDTLQQIYLQATGQLYDRWYSVDVDVVRWAHIAGNEVLQEGIRPGGLFTYLFLTGFVEERPDGDRHYGVVDLAEDPQHYFNRFWSLLIHLLAVMPKNSLLYDRRMAQEDPAEIARKWSAPGETIGIEEPEKSVKVIEGGRMPGGLEQMFSFSDNAIDGSVGVNPYYTGGVQGSLARTSGSVVAAVQQSSNTTLSDLFDSLGQHRKEATQLVVTLISEYWEPVHLAELVGPEMVEFLPRDLRELRKVLDWVRVHEESNTKSSAQDLAQRLANFGPVLQQSGAMPPGALLVKMIAPMMDPAIAKEWERWAEQQQQQQLAQEQMQQPQGPPQPPMNPNGA